MSLLTVHKAKGLEWDTVFLPGWEAGNFPRQPSVSSPDEEWRLAYVGLTRSKTFAAITYARRIQSKGAWLQRDPSPFLKVLPSSSIVSFAPDTARPFYHGSSGFRASSATFFHKRQSREPTLTPRQLRRAHAQSDSLERKEGTLAHTVETEQSEREVLCPTRKSSDDTTGTDGMRPVMPFIVGESEGESPREPVFAINEANSDVKPMEATWYRRELEFVWSHGGSAKRELVFFWTTRDQMATGDPYHKVMPADLEFVWQPLCATGVSPQHIESHKGKERPRHRSQMLEHEHGMREEASLLLSKLAEDATYLVGLRA